MRTKLLNKEYLTCRAIRSPGYYTSIKKQGGIRMHKERFKIGPYVVIILRKGKKILLIRRYQTGFDDGFYACPGGGVDGNEPITNAVIREVHEELGIKIKKENLKMAHVLHSRHADRGECIGFFIQATAWDGEPRNMEPHKCDNIGWFAVDALPENTVLHLIHVLKKIKQGIFYSEFGWE
jgi:ADP-ribose pyrophosphatase YjhB (NUDIX family)